MVGLIDCDNFFCSCERLFRPDLENKPMVVLSNNDGCVVARSREAKAMGIPEGLPYYQLLERYPGGDVIAFSSNYDLYGDLSARVMAVLRTEVPEVMQYSIDEAFLNLESMVVTDIKAWGEALCRKVWRWTGLPVSLGIGPTKTLAKVANRFAKRYTGYRRCCVIGSEEQRCKALKIFPVGDVWGIGRRISRRLEYLGVNTAYDFTCRPRGWVRSKFNVTGERTWAELQGENAIAIDGIDAVERKTILTSRSFPSVITDLGELRSHVANYAARCAVKLRRQGSVCGMLSVFIQSNRFHPDLAGYDNRGFVTFPTPANSAPELVEAAIRILAGIYRRGIRYKRAGVMVSDITPADGVQTDLFYYDPERSAKMQSVSQVIDTINHRGGADTIVLGAQQYVQKEPDGKSIKFVNAIRRSFKSPDYTTRLGAFVVS